MDTSTTERIVAQQRRIVGLAVLAVLTLVAVGVVSLVGSVIGGLGDLPVTVDAVADAGTPDA